ncbi:deoxynucleoside kinase, partial [Listeria monocytogenes]|nr:deoxynucleoside kinase [Listeria monocytogenes]EDB1600919.1 deoxynucleoside kinase [Listeria monocytogenes]
MEGVENKVIVLAGMIGAGKSSYTELIANKLGTKAFYESIKDNRILEMFYEDPKRWA